jgi:hypothetical protein
MPKEITHWHIGVEALKQSPRLHSKMKESWLYEAAFLLGAVSHDSPYYSDIFTPGADDVAEYLHGKDGEDTYQVVRDMFAAGSENTTGYRYMYYYFALGLLSHVILDAALHPFIYYVTGDYYAPSRGERARARTAHRNIESILELYILRNSGTPYADQTIIRLLRSLGPDMVSPLSKVLYNSCKKKLRSKKIRSSSYVDYWKYHSILFLFFSGKVYGSLIRRCPLFPKSIRALARAGREEQFYYIETPLEFKEERVSILELCEQGKKKLVEAFLECENFVLSLDKEIPFKDTWGPSLNSGIPEQGMPDPVFKVVPELLML